MSARSTSRFFSGEALVLALAGAKLILHLLTANRYGIFRDELYYLACGEHLDWGYVDQPPLIALVAWMARHLFGDWLVGLRFFPALAGAATVWLSGKLAREMGGGTFAQVLAALAVVCVPIYLVMHHWLTMNAFEPLVWIACVWCIVRAINRDDPRYWIWFGVFTGLGMQTKYGIAFFVDQVQIMNPILFPLWLGGLVWLFLGREGRRFRVLGIVYIVLLAAFIALRGKNYYLASIYPVLFAAGAIGFEKITAARWKWSRLVYALLVVGSTIILAPTVSPILSPEQFVAYQKKLGFEPPKAENQPTGPLPQYFADEFGWENIARETARVYNSLSPEEQARTAIFANNYGEAGAIDYFGPRLGLPKSICNHQSYWLWGPRDYDGSIVIVLGSDGTGDREHFQSVEPAGRVEHPYSRRDEHFDIFLCRGLTGDLHQFWPRMKNYH